MIIVHSEFNDIRRKPSIAAIEIFGQTIIAYTDTTFTALNVVTIVEKNEAM